METYHNLIFTLLLLLQRSRNGLLLTFLCLIISFTSYDVTVYLQGLGMDYFLATIFLEFIFATMVVKGIRHRANKFALGQAILSILLNTVMYYLYTYHHSIVYQLISIETYIRLNAALFEILILACVIETQPKLTIVRGMMYTKAYYLYLVDKKNKLLKRFTLCWKQ